MINGKRVLAYIPARSGSKSIIDKNIVEVAGKPLIAHTIEAAKKSKYVDKVIVSTDSEKYAAIAQEYGAEAPFLRPAELATDTSPEMDATMHLMQWIEEHAVDSANSAVDSVVGSAADSAAGYDSHAAEAYGTFDIIVRLQTTSPLRTAEDIDGALELFTAKDADAVVSVFECPVTPLWMNTLPDDLCMKNFIPESIRRKNRQELPTYYQLNGVVFAAKWEMLKKTRSWYNEKTYAFIMPKERSVDVDDWADLEFARFLFEKKSKS